jgi:hypothetical protein
MFMTTSNERIMYSIESSCKLPRDDLRSFIERVFYYNRYQKQKRIEGNTDAIQDLVI